MIIHHNTLVLSATDTARVLDGDREPLEIAWRVAHLQADSLHLPVEIFAIVRDVRRSIGMVDP